LSHSLYTIVAEWKRPNVSGLAKELLISQTRFCSKTSAGHKIKYTAFTLDFACWMCLA